MRKYKFLVICVSIAFFVSTICFAQGPPAPPDTPPVGDPVPIDKGILVLAVMALSYGCYIIYIRNKKRAA